jgi:hypothetical protein
MNLIPLANRLEEQGVGTTGKSVFVNYMPAQSETGILLRDYFGGTAVIPELPGYYRASFMMIVRTNDMEAGLQLMRDAIAAVTIVTEEQVEEYLCRYIRPRNLPFVYAPSLGQNIEIAVNMDCCFIDTGA